MDSSVFWIVPERVIGIDAAGITLQDLKEINNELLLLLEESPPESPIHLFVSASKVYQQPNPLEARKALNFLTNPKIGWIAVGGIGNPALHFFIKTVVRMLTDKTRIFPHPESALDFLMQKQSDLPDLRPLWNAYLQDKEAN